MAYGLVYVFDGVTESQYWAVNETLGIARDGTGDWPDGLISHGTGPMANGSWMVTEIWASKGAQESFMSGRLGAAIAAAGVPAPSQLFESELINHQLPG